MQRDLALVGAGYWGKNLARNFNSIGALHTLCDTRQGTLDSYADGFEGVSKSLSFETMLADKQVTKVAIATPAPTHFKLAKQAIAAGKDVYVEKPLCLSSSDASELIDFAEGHGRILMVGHLLQYHPYVMELNRLVNAGALGKLCYITSNRLNLGKIRQEENSLWSFAPHDVSVILGLAGAMPTEVACQGESYLTEGVADTTLTQMAFPGGLRAHVYVSWLNPFKEQKLTVVGSQGMAVFDDTKPWEEKLVLYTDYLTWTDGKVPTAQKRDGQPVVVEQSEPLRNECQHFIESCNLRVCPRTDGKEGARVLGVLNAAQKSLDSGGAAVGIAEPLLADAPEYFAHETAEVDEGAVVGSGSSVWHFSHVSSGAVLGERCKLGQNVFIASGVKVGSNVKIQNNVSLYTGTTIEDGVFLGPSCVLTNVTNPRSEVNRQSLYEKTLIRKGATIGANATIVCGVEVGRFAFVAAGAVVTKSVPDYGFVKGVPAKQVGWMSRHGLPLEFDASGHARCAESGMTYQLKQGGFVSCLDLKESSELQEKGYIAYRVVRST